MDTTLPDPAPQSDHLLLRMEGIYKSFPGVQALRDSKFELRAGEIHALVGENGAGKSTLMKILGGIYYKDEGHVYLDGREVNIISPHMAQELGISIIHQELNLMPHLTVAKELGMEGKIVIIGYDSGQQQMDAIRSGAESGAITQNPVGIGYKCVEAAVMAINGETLPKVIDTGFMWYDKTNIDDPEIQAVLYK